MSVYLIGAGPGDAGLITVKGLHLLTQADVVIYDHLVAEGLLNHTKPEARLIYAGKQSGKHTLSQAEINALLVQAGRQAAETSGSVVRLKGGDPFLFGRGGEEMEALIEAELEFEIVPGVSSAWAVPAYAGIPLTHRDLASSVALVTGQAGADNPEPDWSGLAQSADTLVVLMGMARLEEICNRISAAGLPRATPAAAVEWGTLGCQRKVVGNLADIAAEAAKAELTAPVVLIIGQVAGLGCRPSWFERKPLFNRTIAVTRSPAQAGELSNLLCAMGAVPLELPVIEIKPTADHAPLLHTLAQIGSYSWLVFTSANGVRVFWNMLAANGLDSRILGPVSIAAIGPGTAAALQECCIIPDFVPDIYVAEELACGLRERISSSPSGKAPKPVLILRGNLYRPALENVLRAAGIQVETLSLYDTILPSEAVYRAGLQNMNSALKNQKLDAVTFCSASAVDNFFKLTPPEAFRDKNICFACIGPITAECLKKYGLSCTLQPNEYTLHGLARALEHYFST